MKGFYKGNTINICRSVGSTLSLILYEEIINKLTRKNVWKVNFLIY